MIIVFLFSVLGPMKLCLTQNNGDDHELVRLFHPLHNSKGSTGMSLLAINSLSDLRGRQRTTSIRGNPRSYLFSTT